MSKASSDKAKSRDFFDYVELFGKIVVPLLVLLLGFQIKDSVQQALQQRRLELESGEAIEKLLTKLYGTLSTEEANVSALTLASYGQASILPLIGILEHGSPEAQGGTEIALLTVGLSHPDAVCDALASLIGKRRGQFHWSTHRTAIRVLGQLECLSARAQLQEYAAILQSGAQADVQAWEKMVQRGSPERYGQMREALVEALDALGVAWQPDPMGGGS